MTYRPSIIELWANLKIWQKISAVMFILILTALTVLAALTGIGVIAEAFGVALFGGAIISWLGLTPLALSISGVITVTSTLAFATITKSIVTNPYCMFPSSTVLTDNSVRTVQTDSNVSNNS